MKLYRIKVLHAGPKSSHTSTENYLAAGSEEQVAEWISRVYTYGGWFEDSHDETRGTEARDGIYREVSFREYVMLHRGDIDDEEGWDDAFYGIKKWGWEEIASATPADIETVLRLGIAIQYQPPTPKS